MPSPFAKQTGPDVFLRDPSWIRKCSFLVPCEKWDTSPRECKDLCKRDRWKEGKEGERERRKERERKGQNFTLTFSIPSCQDICCYLGKPGPQTALQGGVCTQALLLCSPHRNSMEWVTSGDSGSMKLKAHVSSSSIRKRKAPPQLLLLSPSLVFPEKVHSPVQIAKRTALGFSVLSNQEEWVIIQITKN